MKSLNRDGDRADTGQCRRGEHSAGQQHRRGDGFDAPAAVTHLIVAVIITGHGAKWQEEQPPRWLLAGGVVLAAA